MRTPTVFKNMSAAREKRILWSAAALLVMAVIFVFSSQPTLESETASDAFAGLFNLEQLDLATRVSNQPILFGLTVRKLAHVCLYAALGFCVYQALAGARRRLGLAAGIALLYGALDEAHQGLVGRYGRWQDVLIDLVGVALGLAAALLLPRLNARMKKRCAGLRPAAARRLDRILDALSLAAVMQYVGYRFLQTTMFPFLYSERYKTATFLSLLIFGGARFVVRFARGLWAEADEKAQIRRTLGFVGACVLAVPFFLVAWLHDYKMLIFIPLLWMCLYDFPAERVFKWYVRVVGVLLAATVLCALAGVVENMATFDSSRFVEAYGILNRTDFAAYFVFLGLFAFCARGKQSWVAALASAALALALGAYLYRLTGSRTARICSVLAALACGWAWLDGALLGRGKRARRLSKAVDGLVVGLFPALMLAFAAAAWLYGRGSAAARRLDGLLSGRLDLAWQVFESHGVRAFGSAFDMHGIGASLIRDGRTYDFLDSSYEYLLVRYGLVLSALIAGLWVWTTVRAIRSGRKGVALSMAVIAAYAFSESHFVDVHYNLLLAMPFCAFAAPSADAQPAQKPVNRSVRWLPPVTAALLGGLAYLVLPRAVSWLRTLFYLRRWNSGMRVLPAFALCTAGVALIWLLWKALNGLAGARRRGSAALAAGVAVALAIAGIACNRAIERGLAEQKASLDAEEADVRLVLDAAEKPVYALQRAELYRRRFGGVAEGILTPEDLLRAREGTLIADPSRELLALNLWGAQYLQFSDSGGLYTFDPAVVDALTARGYELKPYFDSERKCDLADLAQLNGLALDARGGLVLAGPGRSLQANRYVDQWAGAYEVRYALRVDPAALGTDGDAPLCTLCVMGYKGEETLAERVVTRAEFDGEGRCVVTIPYEISATPRTEYRALAAEGATLCVDEIAWRRVG